MRNRERATHMLYNTDEERQRERGGGKKTLLERERQEKLRERERVSRKPSNKVGPIFKSNGLVSLRPLIEQVK